MGRCARIIGGIAVGASLFAVAGARAQAPQFRARTDLVTLDVTVLDRDRKPVRGLTADDFVIIDGGQTRTLTGFTAVDLPPATAAHVETIDAVTPDVATNAAVDGRLITIMFDHSIPSGWGAQAARRVARAIVDQLGPDDRAAIVFSDRTLSQSFTNDRAKLIRVIESPAVGTSLAEAQGVPVGSSDGGSGGTGWSVRQQREQDSPTPSGESGNCYCGLCSLETITTVAESVADVSARRKVLVFIGGYLPLNPEAWGSWTSPCQPYLPPAMQRTLQAAQRANLTVYAFDPNGLIAPLQYGAAAGLTTGGAIAPAGAGSQRSLRSPETLLTAADHTGGRAILNTNAPEERVVEVFEETRAYYLLGLQPPADATPGSFRNLTVRVNRPGVQVRTRRGYYVPGAPDATGGDGSVDPLMTALDSLLPQTALPMSMSLAPFPAPGGASALAVTTTIERDAASSLEMLLAVFDRTGTLVASQRHTVQPESPAASGADEVFTRIDLQQPGGYHVRVAARDTATGRIASVHDVVDVPAFARDRLALSGLAVHASRAPQRSITALSDFLPVVPTTRRTFAADEAVTIYAQVTQTAPAAPVRVTARLFDAERRALLEHSETIDAATFSAGPTFYRLDLPLGRLPPGGYLLNVEATRDAARVSRTMRFGIE